MNLNTVSTHTLLVIAAVIFAYLVATTLVPYQVYEFATSEPSSGGFFGAERLGELIASFAISFVFLTTLLFTAFGRTLKYLWLAVLLLPGVWFAVKFDLTHFWFYILVALVGWAIGFGISKLLSALKARGKNTPV